MDAWWVLELKSGGGIRVHGPFSEWKLAMAFGSRLNVALAGELPTRELRNVLPLLNENPELRLEFEYCDMETKGRD